MDDSTGKRDDIVGTTDYLEAIGVFKAAKNLMFVITMIGVLLMLACFFTANSKYADFEGTIAEQKVASEGTLAREIEGIAAIAASHVAAAATEQQTAGPNVPISAAMTRPLQSGASEPAAASEPVPADKAKAESVKPFKVKFQWIAWVLRVGTFAGVATATLYSLILVFCLKISLVGRLGGINHIARAFIWSLVAMVFLLPWQRYFGGVLAGAVFTPTELMEACTRVTERDMLERIFFYTRFVALPVVVILMMLAAQARSIRWAKATLRRLGVM